MIKINRKASLLIEYTMVIIIFIAALVCMQVYMKRAICGRWRKSADVFGGGRQYEPNVTRITTR